MNDNDEDPIGHSKVISSLYMVVGFACFFPIFLTIIIHLRSQKIRNISDLHGIILACLFYEVLICLHYFIDGVDSFFINSKLKENEAFCAIDGLVAIISYCLLFVYNSLLYVFLIIGAFSEPKQRYSSSVYESDEESLGDDKFRLDDSHGYGNKKVNEDEEHENGGIVSHDEQVKSSLITGRIKDESRKRRNLKIYHITALILGVGLSVFIISTGSLGHSFIGTCSFNIDATWPKYVYGSVYFFMLITGFFFLIKRYCCCHYKKEKLAYPFSNISWYILFSNIGWFASGFTLLTSNVLSGEIAKNMQLVGIWGNLVTIIFIAFCRVSNNYVVDFINKGDTKHLLINSVMIFFCLDDINKKKDDDILDDMEKEDDEIIY